MVSESKNPFVQKIRDYAARLKETKDEKAKAVTAVLSSWHPEVVGTAHMLKHYMNCTLAQAAILKEFLENEKLRGGLETLVSNLVYDFAKRVDEIGNLVESTTNNPEIRDQWESMNDSRERYLSKVKELFPSLSDEEVLVKASPAAWLAKNLNEEEPAERRARELQEKVDELQHKLNLLYIRTGNGDELNKRPVHHEEDYDEDGNVVRSLHVDEVVQ